jgi:uncharacterized protein YcfJ
METTKITTRIHPLMAAAAVSVIVVSLAGTAAITGMLPSSHGASEPVVLNTAQTMPAAGSAAALPGVPATYAVAPTQQPMQPGYAQPVQTGYAQPVAQAQPMPTAYAQPLASAAPAPAPVVIEKTVIKEVPAKPVHRTVHHTSYARNDAPAYYEPAPRPAQPNYVAIGTGAVVGGLIGHQVGGGNGRKLATVAGIIGGGFLGNQMANQNR